MLHAFSADCVIYLNCRHTMILQNGWSCVSVRKMLDVGHYLLIDKRAEDCCWEWDVTNVKILAIIL